MKNCGKNYYEPDFSHIYIEKNLSHPERAESILSHFPHAHKIVIDHYKDVFNRAGQNAVAQRKSRSLILAEKKGTLVYPGAPVCQSFGNDFFYYTSVVMNCLFDCEYCYLKGMYPSGHLVIFLNLEEVFAEVDALLGRHPLYLCISYDTDLPALEPWTGYVREWCEFAGHRSDLTIEIRTKSGDSGLWRKLPQAPNVIFAFTLSPDSVIRKMEGKTPGLSQRLAAAREAGAAGFPIRFCFDPMLRVPHWKTEYGEMIHQVRSAFDFPELKDISIGTFRISKDYLKKMRRTEPGSAAAQYPYTLEDGVYGYRREDRQEMMDFLLGEIGADMPGDRIFLERTARYK